MLALIDQNLRTPRKQHLDDLREKGLVAIAKAAGAFENEEEERHAREDALGAGWWPEHPAKEEILRAAYIRAIEISIASGSPKPISTLWVRGLNRFEAAVVEYKERIIVHWLTPDPPVALPPPFDEVNARMEEGIWAVGLEERVDGYIASFEQQGYPIEGRIWSDATAPGTKAFHIIGY
jgi:hypothetical protein